MTSFIKRILSAAKGSPHGMFPSARITVLSLFFALSAAAQNGSVVGAGAHAASAEQVIIYPAREVITLDSASSVVSAVAVRGNDIVGVGSLASLSAAYAEGGTQVDSTFEGKTIVPGFIAQHDHPMLTAMTMSTHIIAIEDWDLPQGYFPKASGEADYRQRLRSAEQAMGAEEAPLVTWGFHQLFHGSLNRAVLDGISETRPILVLHRSWHELYVNSPGLALLGIDEKTIETLPEHARAQADLDDGHFFEAALFALAPKLMGVVSPPAKFMQGLEYTKAYFHRNGVTLASEPGGMYSKQLQQAQNAVLSAEGNPFEYLFIPDGKSISALFPETTIAETEATLSWGQGRTRMLPKQIKLFADGAVYSQLMQLSEPYLDGHQGEWIMPGEAFNKAFETYWNAGYQIHIHVSGDAGVDRTLDALEINMKRNPREDHRTTLVHFAVSRQDQLMRIKSLGAIVSANPYYVTALADKFGEFGLGPERADEMVRLGDLTAAGVSFSLHSDMPMAPAQPLFLMHAAVNRTTASNRVAAPEQKINVEQTLRAVTIDAAYSLRLEKDVGSIEAGKRANFTVLESNPLAVDPSTLKDIEIWGTVERGRKLPL